MSRLLAALSVLLVLSACGGAPPAESPTPTPSPTKSTEAAPAMPELAKEDSKEGAKAFVDHYIETLNLAQKSGDVRQLRLLSGTQCNACNRAIDSIAELYRQGGRLEGGAWRTGRYVSTRDPKGGWLITMRASYGEQRSIAPGEPVRTFTGGSATYDFTVSALPGRKVLRWSRVN